MQIPDVQYARSGDVSIAYQVVGEGPTDIVFYRGTAGDLLSTSGLGLEFEERGTHELKGVPGEWQLYAVANT